ncbi:hypothetical protein IRP63_16100 [Clostridium phage CWou-2020a]|uniref:hypothetical protein n=1 Tax=Clostridium botulinum TaxID=1491 RepID=UPI000B2648B8|nr:hypothetical protein [Clostridium botulinum]QPW59441.1 hypothetical protein IRP63_16100 [Clostridium phage CWou-2020a]MCD3234279.1 hypothetical protein [Clostridium botulinum D/C]MCD3241425.1 hypothetical protein [Clostridium botulinum D/C]MCD3267698.1 hypothetical protein [Clostridium botulinum D/C]MCD3299814.1 hypothetical protein [Clostridium botulinum D/C]
MIKDKNKKFSVILPKEFYEMLVEEAEYEDRSISKMAAQIIKKHYTDKFKNK